MVCAVWLFTRMLGWTVTVGLWSPSGVLWRYHHSHGIVDCENNEREQDGSQEKSLRARFPLADLEDGNPEEPDADCSYSNNGSGEEEENQKEEDYVVNWENFGSDDEQPVDGLKDVNVSQKVTTFDFANRVLGFVDASDEHRCPDKKNNNNEQETADELDGSEDCLHLHPRSHQKR